MIEKTRIMYVVAILLQKGGSGKTTLAQCLAVAAMRTAMAVAILDMDPQLSISNWKKRRDKEWEKGHDDSSKPDPAVLSASPANVDEQLDKLYRTGADIVFIDTPPRLSDWAMEGARCADLIILPSRPTIKDLETVGSSIKLATVYHMRPAFVVLTQARPRGKRNQEAEDFIREKNLPVCPTRLGFRVDYEDADALGQTPQEYKPLGEASDEIARVYGYTRKLLGQLAERGEIAYAEKNQSDRRFAG